MRSIPRLASILFIAGASLGLSGCGRGDLWQDQLKKKTVSESKQPDVVLKAAETVIRERYYQVKVYPHSNHIVALTPIVLEGNQQTRKKIDISVFYENGYWMPKVWVRKFIDVAEPDLQKGPISGRFPIEVVGYPAASDDWRPLYYDRTEGQEILDAILEKLKIPS